jgi:hypothetical protein
MSHLSKKLLPACKPDSVPSLRRVVIIYLSCRLPGGSICLPSIEPRPKSRGLRRAAFNRWYTWHFSMQGLPTMTVARHSRELLPHVFTITPGQRPGAVIFCGTFCYRPRIKVRGKYPALHRCIALRCPDFPPRKAER